MIRHLIPLLLLSASAVAHTPQSENALQPEKDHVTLQLRWHHQFQFAGYYAALAKGFYDDAGLTVTLVAGGPGQAAPIDRVLEGEADFGVSGSGLVVEYLNGRAVVALAAIFQHSPIVWLVRADSGIVTPHDMTGKRAMSLGGHNSAELRAIFLFENIPLDKITFQTPSYALHDLIEGRTDAYEAYISNEPYFLTQQGIEYRLIEPARYGVNFYGDVLFTGQAVLQQYPATVQAFVEASLKGWEYAWAHPEEIIALIHSRYAGEKTLEHLRFEAEKLRALAMPDLVRSGHMSPGRWRFIADTYGKLGMAKADRNLEDFFYQPEAKPDLSHIYRILFIALGVSLAALLVLAWFIGLNRRLKREVAAHRKAQAALRESECNYRHIFNAVNDAIFIHDSDSGQILDVNHTFEEMYRCNRATALRLSIADFSNGEAGDMQSKAIGLVRKTLHEGPQSFEWQSRRRSGENFWSEVNLKPVELSGATRVLAVVRDISERRQAEDILQQRNRHLSLVNRIARLAGSTLELDALLKVLLTELQNLLGAAAASVWLYQPEAEQLQCRQAVGVGGGNIVGWQLSATQGISGWVLQHRESQLIHDTHSDERHQRSVNQHSGVDIRALMSVPLIHQDQAIGVLNIADTMPGCFGPPDLTLLEAVAGHAAAAIVRARLYTQLHDLKERAEAANQAKSAFLANMSHELRTPLNAVLGFAQILDIDSALPEKHREHVRNIRRGGDYLLTLINDILDLTKIEAGRFELLPERFSPVNFFANLTEMFKIRAEQKNIEFRAETLIPMPAQVRADEKRLRQILMNLLSNAVKFTSQGSVTLRAGLIGDNLYFEVEDTGTGIAPEQLNQIFEPFSQVGADYYKPQGTGLGLAITRKLTHLMHGSLKVDSHMGQGTVFKISVPVEVLSGPRPPAAASPPQTAVTGYHRTRGEGPLRVLLADDVTDNRQVLHSMLAPLGFSLEHAADGHSCVSTAQRWHPDVILMDLRMPEMDGLQATRALREQPGFADLPIIAVSAGAFAEDRAACQEAGCNAHLSKPVALPDLLYALQTCLPLEWQYADPNSAEPPSAPPETDGPGFSAEQREILLAMIRKGAVGKVRDYLNNLSQEADCPSEVAELLQLAKRFRLQEIRRRLEGNR